MATRLAEVTVVKIGGSTLGSHDTTIEDVVSLQKQGRWLVVVHGGGKLITEWLKKQGVTTRTVRGERVTDAATLDVVTAVLAGLVNKQLVADINRRGGRAVGISGVDACLIQSRIKDKELGYVGEVTAVDTAFLTVLLQAGYVPVLATVSFNTDKSGPGLLNVNADAVAGDIAAAIGAARLVFLTDVPGILDKQGKLLSQLSSEAARELVASGVASGGMIPKINACLRALSGAGTTCIIDGREPHALLREIQSGNVGTRIRR